MTSPKRVAVVTGSNKGIGFAAVRALCKQFDGDVILTARSESSGQEAVAELNKEGFNPRFHQLDILIPSSVEQLRDFLQSTYGGLDVLINNAAIAFKSSSTASFGEQAEVSMATNFTATKNICDTLLPILRPHARVVNVASYVAGRALVACSPEIQAQLKSELISMKELEDLMQQFVKAAKAGKHKDEGWPEWAYAVTKIGVILMTFIQDRKLRIDPRPDIVINACCPGNVRTDMSSGKGDKSPDEGADTPVYLALLPLNTTSPRGEYVKDRTIQNWY